MSSASTLKGVTWPSMAWTHSVHPHRQTQCENGWPKEMAARSVPCSINERLDECGGDTHLRLLLAAQHGLPWVCGALGTAILRRLLTIPSPALLSVATYGQEGLSAVKHVHMPCDRQAHTAEPGAFCGHG